jgi:hypothetical protein
MGGTCSICVGETGTFYTELVCKREGRDHLLGLCCRCQVSNSTLYRCDTVS